MLWLSLEAGEGHQVAGDAHATEGLPVPFARESIHFDGVNLEALGLAVSRRSPDGPSVVDLPASVRHPGAKRYALWMVAQILVDLLARPC
jgi:hypothetical protein